MTDESSDRQNEGRPQREEEGERVESDKQPERQKGRESEAARYVHSLAHKADGANVQEQTADSRDAPAMELSPQGYKSFQWKTYPDVV